MEPASKNKIELPEDKPTELFVLSMASNFVMLKMYTKTVYELETANQEINSLSNLPRDVEKASWRKIAALKRHYGSISDIPQEKILKRPPNWLTIIVVLFTAVGVIAYGSYSGQLYVWGAGLTLYQGYIVVGVLLLIAFVLLFRYGLRRRRKV